MLHRHPTLSEGARPIEADVAAVGALSGESAARAFFEPYFATSDPARETLFVAHLDAQARCVHLSRHDGAVATADMPLRTIIADAVSCDSKGLVLAHNHPSGDPTPSATDRRATRRLATAAEAIDLTLLDHLVFGGGHCCSFRRMGLL